MTDRTISVLYEHEDFLVCDKPAGLAFHTEGNDEKIEGFVSLLRKQLSTQSLYPVHRLDRVTSGLMLVAKNENANRALSQLFQERAVKKVYLAVSDKRPKKKQGLISGDMQKARGGSYKLCRTHGNPAITRFHAANIDGGWAFWLMPETGKTHQLRVACKSLGSPIIGDSRYGGSEAERCFLHAYQLSFHYAGQEHCISAPPDAPRLVAALRKFQERFERA